LEDPLLVAEKKAELEAELHEYQAYKATLHE
jgi:hypothetical protein